VRVVRGLFTLGETKLLEALEKAGVWEVADRDLEQGEVDSEVLHTRLEVHSEGKAKKTTWHGTENSQLLRLADAIFGSSAGPELVGGLARVAEPMHDKQDTVRQEILMQSAAGPVIPIMLYAHPCIEFTPHPTMNGFYVVGSRKHILQLRSEIGNFDRCVEPPPIPSPASSASPG
jgi:hypothetical protein